MKKRAHVFALAFFVLATLAATATVGSALPSRAPGCATFAALKGAFPTARAAGFTARQPVVRGQVRGTIWPGTCARWFTRYRRPSAGVDISMTLYKTHKQAVAALSEPAYGAVERLSNGALVRKDRAKTSVNGVTKQYAGVDSVYRNVLIGSVSIADKAISLPAQIRLHREIDSGVLRLS
jgi:hypothetical protein